MKTTVTIIICILFSLPLIAQNDTDLLAFVDREVSQNDIKRQTDDLLYVQDENEPYTGKVYLYYPNGKMQEETVCIDGVEIRKINWFKSGSKKSEISYMDGFDSGTSAYWYESGVKRSEFEYLPDGKLIVQTWYENGELRSVKEFDNGYKTGVWTEWYDNGQKKTEGNYKNDSRIGDWTRYSREGKVIKERFFIQ